MPTTKIASLQWSYRSILIYTVVSISTLCDAEIDMPSTGQHSNFSQTGDYLLWTKSSKMAFLHKTYAYFADANPLNTKLNGGILDKTVLFESGWNGEIWGLASNFHNKKVYYTDYAENYIGVYDLKTHRKHKVFQGMAFGIDSISVDYLTGNVYWGDSEYNWIMVADSSFTSYTNIIQIKTEIPALVAVHPHMKYLYYTENGEEGCKIWRSDLSGNKITLLYNLNNTKNIDDMIIDYNHNKLYWCERRKGSTASYISYVLLEDDEHTHTTPPQPTTFYKDDKSHFFGIASYKNHIYTTDYTKSRILAIDKSSKELVFTETTSPGSRPRKVNVFSRYEQPINGDDEFKVCDYSGCQHLCLGSSNMNGFECQCRVGFRLQYDRMYCGVDIVLDNFALIADPTHKRLYQLYMPEPETLREIRVDGVEGPSAIDFDHVTQNLFWADKQTKKIYRAGLYGNNKRTVIEDVTAFSITIDSSSSNLYWIDSMEKALKVSNLNGQYIKKLHHLDLVKVWAMTIDTKRGYLYWSDWKTDMSGVIESSDMDGSNRREVVNNTSFPHAITIDVQKNILFWTEVQLNIIGWKKLSTNEEGRYTIQTSPDLSPKPYGLAYYKDHLYLTEFNAKNILKIPVLSLINGNTSINDEEKFGPEAFYALSGIKIYNSGDMHTEIASCSYSQCPHLCIPVHSVSGTFGQCFCEDDFEYHKESNQCLKVVSSTMTTYANNSNSTNTIRPPATTTASVILSPPSFGYTCPDDINIYTSECEKEAIVDFIKPSATDEDGNNVYVFLLGPYSNPPLSLGEGNHNFYYKARDGRGQTASCIFFVNVIVRRCVELELDIALNKSEPSCGRIYGSTVNITCPNNTFYYQYVCGSNQQWQQMGSTKCDGNGFSYLEEGNTIIASNNSKQSSNVPVAAVVVPILILILLLLILLFILHKRSHWVKQRFSLGWRRQNDDTEHLYQVDETSGRIVTTNST